mgnify:CR=1 FL=1|jgi:hypothetical protein
MTVYDICAERGIMSDSQSNLEKKRKIIVSNFIAGELHWIEPCRTGAVYRLEQMLAWGPKSGDIRI